VNTNTFYYSIANNLNTQKVIVKATIPSFYFIPKLNKIKNTIRTGSSIQNLKKGGEREGRGMRDRE
jgi:hypothetical protein